MAPWEAETLTVSFTKPHAVKEPEEIAQQVTRQKENGVFVLWRFCLEKPLKIEQSHEGEAAGAAAAAAAAAVGRTSR